MNKEFLNNVGLAMRRNFENNKIAASQIIVERHGKTEYEYKVGLSDVENAVPIKDDSIYRIYSMTKPITMAAIMRLVEKGLIFLEDPISEFIPEFKNTPVAFEIGNNAEKVTQCPQINVKHLLTMTSGLSYPGEEDWGARSMAYLERTALQGDIPTLEVVKCVAKNVMLSFQPGDRWKYGYSHDVAGALIEVVSGMKLGEYMKKEIFEPLGMKDTAFWVPEDKLDRFVNAYTVENGAFKRLTDPEYNDKYTFKGKYESGGGGLVSTAHDYSRFCQALVNGGTLDGYRLLGRKTIEMMSANQLNDRQMKTFSWLDRGYGYGLGMRVFLKPWMINGSVGEYGWDGMMGTFMAVDPVQDMTITYMQNMFPYSNNGFRLFPIIYAAL